MNRMIRSDVISKDTMRIHKVELTVQFKEPVTSFEAQSIVNQAMADYMAKQSREDQDD